MASGIPIQGGSSSAGVANVDANFNLNVVEPIVLANIGYIGLASIVSEGTVYPSTSAKQGRRIESSDSNRVRAGVDSTMFSATFPAAAIDLGVWNQSTATMTIAVASGFMNLNSGNSVATTVDAIAKTWRYFPIFQDLATRFDCILQFPVTPQTNTTMEWGLFLAATTAAPTDGVLFRQVNTGNLVAVVNFNGTETTQIITGFNLAASTRYEFSIIVDTNQAYFYINNVLATTINVPTTGAISTAAAEQPICFRIYNGGSAPASANQIKVSSATVTLLDGGAGRSWHYAQSAMGGNAIQNTYNGTTTGQTASYANSAAPASAALSNTAAGYTTLGGQWQFAALAGAETDYALFAYQVPAGTAAALGKTLHITGIRIDSFNMGAASATTPTLLQWGVSAGSSAVTLAGTVDSAGVKIVRRVALGCQSLAVGAPIGANFGTPIDTQFATPLIVNQGEFFHVILKVVVCTATASEIIRGTCFINGYFD
jgi:hypothetical protein